MKIILVGASGTIGRHLAADFAQRHEVVAVGRSSGDVQADIESIDSIRELYAAVGAFDAVVNAAGGGYFGPFDEMGDAEFRQGINGKLMGQVNLVLEGRKHIADGGSFTLTTGILANDPVRMASNLSAVNGALHSFVRAVAMELSRGIRLNAISPGLVEPSAAELGSYFPGHIPVTMERTVAGYCKSLEGGMTGQVIEVH
ncbi:MAG: short chain dehydrogenase [Planctomycetota bacterium]|nr:short chain dehydrogenase [Planctomycetota bacterium]